ncbi:unnamed protein product, partial [Hydatigera taeniaeformis]|uniref:GMC_oxred_C domain-containing protein n=1 Tax=Hydatigena taeniaeformis TaxID=6205 RepID=A0A0R3WY31_HYDTA
HGRVAVTITPFLTSDANHRLSISDASVSSFENVLLVLRRVLVPHSPPSQQSYSNAVMLEHQASYNTAGANVFTPSKVVPLLVQAHKRTAIGKEEAKSTKHWFDKMTVPCHSWDFGLRVEEKGEIASGETVGMTLSTSSSSPLPRHCPTLHHLPPYPERWLRDNGVVNTHPHTPTFTL